MYIILLYYKRDFNKHEREVAKQDIGPNKYGPKKCNSQQKFGCGKFGSNKNEGSQKNGVLKTYRSTTKNVGPEKDWVNKIWDISVKK